MFAAKNESQCLVSTKDLPRGRPWIPHWGTSCTIRVKEVKVGLKHHIMLPPCTAATHLQDVVELHFELKVGLGLDDDLLQRLLEVLHAGLGVLTQLGDALVLPLAAETLLLRLVHLLWYCG